MKKQFTFVFGVVIASVLLLYSASSNKVLNFKEPIDAISFAAPSSVIEAEILLEDGWQPLEIETEFDPKLQITNLVVFNTATNTVTVRGKDAHILVAQPIRLEHKSPSYEVAALSNTIAPKILSRRQWGADDAFLIRGSASAHPNADVTDVEQSLSTREVACEQLQTLYSNEFKTTKTVTSSATFQPLRWPQSFSPKIHTLVVHHTASNNSTDARSGWERMQALYAYHANNRGWGDVGYNYVIDQNGQIYEGRAGGDYVVGGHAYCNNIGTMGIALMGNFENEQPTNDQTKSLQWLLIELGEKYGIDHTKSVQYHGTKRASIIGHRDVVQTQCPGKTLYGGLPEIIDNVQRGNFSNSVAYPRIQTVAPATQNRRVPTTRTQSTVSTTPITIRSNGGTSITARPGGSINIPIIVDSTVRIAKRGRIAEVTRSSSQIGVWQRLPDGSEVRVRSELIATQTIQANTSSTVQIRVQIPREEGSYSLKIGAVQFTISTEGRRTRAPVVTDRFTVTDAPGVRSQRGRITQTPLTTRAPATVTDQVLFPSATTTSNNPNIRIKLSYEGQSAQLALGAAGGFVQGLEVQNTVTIEREGSQCVTTVNGKLIRRSVLQFTSRNDSTTIASWDNPLNTFRGMIECRVENDALILINELPMEEYLWGLSEQPDSEPYEKQRTFAIAARSYASHYLDSAYRKFPGKPYDGNDSPANFQKYSGRNYEQYNPRWIRAVKDTAGLVVTKSNQIVKTPYYSSNDGRTRSPAENGWPNFLFAEVFSSKPDPWCEGQTLRGHGVGMSGCGAEGQANEGAKAEAILNYYYPGTTIQNVGAVLRR